jgi:hypothetical protein
MEHFKALIVVLLLAIAVFAFAKNFAAINSIELAEFSRRRDLWLLVTTASFLAHNFWLYVCLVGILLWSASSREQNRAALFFFLLFAIPPIKAEVPGLGLANYIIEIDYVRLLTLTILLPAFLDIRKLPERMRFGSNWVDRFVLSYLILGLLLAVSSTTITNAVRVGVVYSFIDIFLPYYVMSRSLATLGALKGVALSFVISAMLLSAVAVVETTRHWLLYSTLESALGVAWEYGNYTGRGEGLLRAQASTGHPIVLGYVLTVALGFWFYLSRSIASSNIRLVGSTLLIVALLASVSRGPWIGALVAFLIYIATGPMPAKRLLKYGVYGLVLSPVILLSPAGERFISVLPFVGTVGEDAVTYREQLLAVSIELILENPLMGASDFLYSMEELRQGEGIIDLVNTYLAIGLRSGLVGLIAFCGVFVAAAVIAFRGLSIRESDSIEFNSAGRALLAVVGGILVIIFTTSSITFIPVIYWSVAGLCVAYGQVIRDRKPLPPNDQERISLGQKAKVAVAAL